MHWRLGMLILLTACSAEREFSGIWQQVCDEAHPCEAGGLRYELHLGRFGDAVTGLVVRYRDPGPDFDPFRKSNDCGCFVVDSGRAGATDVRFRLDAPDQPGFPDEEGTRDESCEPAPAECDDRAFSLRATEDDALEGVVGCGDAEVPVRFVAVSGRTRTACLGVGE